MMKFSANNGHNTRPYSCELSAIIFFRFAAGRDQLISSEPQICERVRIPCSFW